MQDENTDWLIAKNGLICPANYAVFAHNRLASFDAMFPYFLDVWDFHSDMFLVEGYQFTAYSFWRIDTQKAGVNWYVDPNMKTDAELLGFNPYNYVCSIQSIPNSALKLFTIDRPRYVDMSPTLMVGNGVVSIKPYTTDFDALKPVRKINHYLAKISKQAVWFAVNRYWVISYWVIRLEDYIVIRFLLSNFTANLTPKS